MCRARRHASTHHAQGKGARAQPPQRKRARTQAVYLARHYLVDGGDDCAVVPEFGESKDGLRVVNLFAIRHVEGAAV